MALSVAQALDTWESGRDLDTVGRALALLAASQRDATPEGLAQWPLGKRDRALLDLRLSMFGDQVAASCTCPSCENELQFEFAIGDLGPGGGADAGFDGGEIVVELPTARVRCRQPDSLALRAAATSGPAGTRLALVRSCVAMIEPEGTVEELDDRDVAAIGEHLAHLDPDAMVSIAVNCVDCETSFETAFSVDTFLWAELESWAHRTLCDIHELAIRYHWSESEILAMSPFRRRYYLEAVGT